MTVSEQKKEWRTRCAAIRSAVSAEQKKADDAALCRAILSHPAFLEADLLLCFCAVRGEPDLSPVAEEALRRGIAVAYPRCVEKEMLFHTVGGQNELLPDRFGIPAPAATAPLAVPTRKTLCLLPGLAANKAGFRLGYGGGFYDRFLATFGGITLFPVYQRLIFDALPVDAYDRRVDHIVTEKGDRVDHV